MRKKSKKDVEQEEPLKCGRFDIVPFMTYDDKSFFNFNLVVYGARGQGKTKKIIQMLRDLKDVFQQIHIFHPLFEIDATWQAVKHKFPHVCIHSKFEIEEIQSIVDSLDYIFSNLSDVKQKDQYRTLCLLDDSSGGSINALRTNVVSDIAIRGRHKITFMASVQNYMHMKDDYRRNLDAFICHDLMKQGEKLRRTVWEEQFQSLCPTFEYFDRMMEDVCSDDSGTAAAVIVKGGPQSFRNGSDRIIYQMRNDPTIFTSDWRMNCRLSWYIQENFAKTPEEMKVEQQQKMVVLFNNLEAKFKGPESKIEIELIEADDEDDFEDENPKPKSSRGRKKKNGVIVAKAPPVRSSKRKPKVIIHDDDNLSEDVKD